MHGYITVHVTRPRLIRQISQFAEALYPKNHQTPTLSGIALPLSFNRFLANENRTQDAAGLLRQRQNPKVRKISDLYPKS